LQKLVAFDTLPNVVKRGYARVSTDAQDLELQVEALRGVGCSKVYQDKLSGRSAERPGLQRLLREVEPGDQVVVYKLDRIARSLRDLLNITFDLGQRRIGFRSLHDPINIDGNQENDPMAQAMAEAQFQMIGVFAQLERAFIVGRTSAGREIAKRKGVKFGRKPKLTEQQLAMARDLIATGNHTLASVARSLGVHRATLWRHLESPLMVKVGIVDPGGPEHLMVKVGIVEEPEPKPVKVKIRSTE
jgi:DNA invertase Pin-like site-specific DNA recombinase